VRQEASHNSTSAFSPFSLDRRLSSTITLLILFSFPQSIQGIAHYKWVVSQTPLALRSSRVPVGRLLVHPSDAQQFFLFKRRSLNLQADGQIRLRESAGNADAGDAREVAANRVDIRQVHLQRVLGFLTDFESGRRRGRAHDNIALGKGIIEI